MDFAPISLPFMNAPIVLLIFFFLLVSGKDSKLLSREVLLWQQGVTERTCIIPLALSKEQVNYFELDQTVTA